MVHTHYSVKDMTSIPQTFWKLLYYTASIYYLLNLKLIYSQNTTILPYAPFITMNLNFTYIY